MSSSDYEARRRQSTKDQIVAAYDGYKRQEPGSESTLMELVRKFAYTKLRYLDFDLNFNSGAADADDWAQEVALDVWKRLDTHRGDTGESFYAWIHRIAFNTGADAAKSLLSEKRQRADLYLEVTDDDDGEVFEEDNPEIYMNAALIYKSTWNEKDADGNLLWEYDRETVPGSKTSPFQIGESPVSIPRWVRGVNLQICHYILRGMNYREIGELTGMTEKSVKNRMSRIRERVERERGEREGEMIL